MVNESFPYFVLIRFIFIQTILNIINMNLIANHHLQDTKDHYKFLEINQPKPFY